MPRNAFLPSGSIPIQSHPQHHQDQDLHQHHDFFTNTSHQAPDIANSATSNSSQDMPPVQNGGLSGIDLSALQGISPQQLALIAHLLQTGQLPLPPPPPASAGSALRTAYSPVSQVSATSVPKLPTAVASTSQAVPQDTDMDREEGELEEGDVEDTPASRDFLRTPPKGPRNRSRSPLSGRLSATDGARGSQQSQRLRIQRPATAPRKPSSLQTVTNAGHMIGETASATLLCQDASIKAFVAEMQNAGYGFQQVAKEVTDVPALRRLYQQLKIPLAVEAITNEESLHNARPPTQEVRKVSVTKRPAPPKPPVTQDRVAFIARLQAAKNKKSDTPATTVRKGIEDTAEATKAAMPAPSATALATTPKPASPFGEPERAKMNDLVKQRLAALTAERAAKQHAAKAGDGALAATLLGKPDLTTRQQPRSGEALKSSLGDGLVEAASKAASEVAGIPLHPDPRPHVRVQSDVPTPATKNVPTAAQPSAFSSSESPTLNRGFGLPGLFTTATSPASQQRSGAASPSVQPPGFTPQKAIPIARSHASSHNQAQSPVPNALSKQPPPPARSASFELNGMRTYPPAHARPDPEESFIIQDSEEDDSGDEMDIDDSEQDEQLVSGEHLHSKLQGPATDFTVEAEASKTTESSTTAISNTSNSAYQRRLREIADLKNRIAMAERGKRQKASNSEFNTILSDYEATAAKSAVNGMTGVPSVFASENVTPVAETGSIPDDNEMAVETNPAVVRTSSPSTQLPSSPANRPSPSNAAPVSLSSRKQEVELLRLRMEAARRQISGAANGSGGVSHAPVTARSPAPMVPSPKQNLLPLESFPKSVANPGFHPGGRTEHTADAGEHVDSLSSSDDEAMYASNEALDYGREEPKSGLGDTVTPPLAGTILSKATTTGVRPLSSFGTKHAEATQPFEDARFSIVPGSRIAEIPIQSTDTTHNPHMKQDTDDFGDHDTEDEDDLDEIYERSTLPPTLLNASMAAEAAPVTSGDESDEDKSEVESEDAMDTSDDLDAVSDDIEPQHRHDPEQSPPHRPSPERFLDGDHTDENIGMTGDASPNIDDELAPELQPPREELAVPSEKHPKSQSFRPYESPLALFKDFRYHPGYLNTVPGGFKSLTYCHKIDPSLTVCPWETAGGECYDNACQYQHFKNMGLSDNDLLRTMGTEKTPVKTFDEDKRWKSGLNGVVQELRNTNQGKDVAAIARRIAEYRRDFRGDPTKTLLLD